METRSYNTFVEFETAVMKGYIDDRNIQGIIVILKEGD